MMDSNFVSSATAEIFAKRITNNVFLGLDSNSTVVREISTSFTIPDKQGAVALYVFNYKNDSGYVVLSADYRHQPICAFVANGQINIGDDIPSALGSWFGRTVENIDLLRDGSYNNTAIGYYEWNVLFGRVDFDGPPTDFTPVDNGELDGGGGCDWWTPVNITRGPLMNTNWGQGCTFNNQCPPCNPIFPNSNGGPCGFKLTGCVATAMVQVIRYWSNTNTYGYNYASMPNNTGNGEVQRLMRDAGNSVNMSYGCNSSGAISNKIHTALIVDYDYETAEYNPNYQDADQGYVMQEFRDGKPVIFGGCTEQSSFLGLFSWGSGNCHAWVCDGYRVQGNQCEKQYWYRMNWGWRDVNVPSSNSNGWYLIDDWTVGSRNYQYANDLVHNIHP